MPFKILVVDDDPADLACTELVLSGDPDFHLVTTTQPEEAISIFKKDPDGFAAVLVDYHMPKNGLLLAREIFDINPYAVVAMLSADQSRDVLKDCLQVGIRGFLEKRENEEIIRSSVRGLCGKWEGRPRSFDVRNTKDANEKRIASIGLVGRSTKMAEVADLVRKVAPLDASVFIHGESGVGKELVARAIHRHSNRRDRPFVAINVNAIPENLAESELFGHVKGAFTGADRHSDGKLLAANGGTLFLDEIGDLKPEVQVKLLRVLQERRITPVGGTRSTNLDVRLISATHVDLEKAILEGRFREDLYFRLHVVPIEIPSLRERPEDIEPMIAHFLKAYGGESRRISAKAVQMLERYRWRGNVRELENEIQRLLAFADRNVEPAHLSERIRKACDLDEASEGTLTFTEFSDRLHEMELAYLRSQIRRCGSLREACRTVFRAPVSSIHTRIRILEQNLGKKGELFHEERA